MTPAKMCGVSTSQVLFCCSKRCRASDCAAALDRLLLQLCNALHQLHGPANFICGSFDWAAATGQCCLNPPGPGRYLRSDDPSFLHSVKVCRVSALVVSAACRMSSWLQLRVGDALNEFVCVASKVADGSVWKCPSETVGACPVNNTRASCSAYAGPIGGPVVGHDFLLSTSTHTDGRRAFTLMNFDTAFTAVPTVVIPSATTNVRVSVT